LELAGNSPAELIKRSLPSDGEILASSRYHNKSQIRILIDDESVGSGTGNVAGIPAGKGLKLSQFIPSPLDGNVLKMVADDGTVTGRPINQVIDSNGTTTTARTVRGVKSSGETYAGYYIPPGSGIQGRILIEIVKPDGTTVDVTQEILSMGVTVGEPNGIIYLQRPLWAAFVQGSRDRSGNSFDLVRLTKDSTLHIADGEIADPTGFLNTARGFISANSSSMNEDTGNLRRNWKPPATEYWNEIVPINVYNVREGWVRNTLPKENVYLERGVTSVIEINMRNLARWFDGVYGSNLLTGTNTVSVNIKGDEG
jgi:hypothetical protein